METEFPSPPPPILAAEKAPVIGTAGPLEFDKGHDVFVRSIPLILQACPGTQFVIAGTGPEEHKLRQLVRDLRVSECVTFVCGMADMSIAIEAMDIFVLPSLRQGLGRSCWRRWPPVARVIATQAAVSIGLCEKRNRPTVPPRNAALGSRGDRTASRSGDGESPRPGRARTSLPGVPRRGDGPQDRGDLSGGVERDADGERDGYVKHESPRVATPGL